MMCHTKSNVSLSLTVMSLRIFCTPPPSLSIACRTPLLEFSNTSVDANELNGHKQIEKTLKERE